MYPLTLLAPLLLAGLLATGSEKEIGPAEPEILFARHVYPLLQTRCFPCHGQNPSLVLADLNLTSREGLLKGGKSGRPAVVPSSPEQSLMLQAVSAGPDVLPMPPKENDRLTADEIGWMRDWIAAGAPWPDLSRLDRGWAGDAESGGLAVRTSGGQSETWTSRRYQPEDLWAYHPVVKPDVPEVPGVSHPIDAFLRRKLHSEGYSGAPPADRPTLIRRAAFDLTGLPPRPDQIDSYRDDPSPGWYERLIGDLLASPHYGERWAQHWLDVVRYADTSGFSNDYERPNAWRYRDYVIRSFNQDKPYDQFVLEQIAGDELDPQDPDQLIATGFLRMGPWEHTGMAVAAVTRQQFLDDVTHSVGVTFLGQGLRCARCHDHKFDPIPTRDYYRVQAVFAPVQFADREVSYQPQENISDFPSTRQRTERLLEQARADRQRLAAKSDAAIALRLKELGVEKLQDLPESDRPRRRFFGLDDLERSLDKILAKRVAYYEREMTRYEPLVFGVYNGPLADLEAFGRSTVNLMPAPEKLTGDVQAVHILNGGALETPGEQVSPGVLSVISGLNPLMAETGIPQQTSGRRLALARWIVDPRHPLTARVIVNRVWQYHFGGRGLVATPNDFGKMGARPTHPELLDWLAVWFVDNGWSLKKLHRLIMTSEAYRQSSSHPEIERLQEVDSGNRWLAYYPIRRLTAEEIRDALLAVTGELNAEMGGPGIYPEIHPEVALQPRHIMGSIAPAYQPSPRPEQRHRRTIYAFRYRTLADPMLEVLNRPGADVSCERREESTVATQVFALFNSRFSQDRALALAHRLRREQPSAGSQVTGAFLLLLGRLPGARELELSLEHLGRLEEFHRDHQPTRETIPRTVHRKMVEEMTGEEFSWDEELDIAALFQPDLKPWDVEPETRALAEVCLVLLNSNRFVYIR